MSRPREAEIRAAIAAHPTLDDRAIARIVGINRWSTIRPVRAAMAAEADAAGHIAGATCGTDEPAQTAPARRYPPLGSGSTLALLLLQRQPDPPLRYELYRAYLRARAIDFGIYQGDL